MKRDPLGLLAFLLPLAGCATVDLGEDFDLEVFEERVAVGETRRTEVRRWLGESMSTGQMVNSDGIRLEEWTYYHATGRLPGLKDAQLKYLEVRFRPEGTVDSYEWNGE